MLYFDYDFLVIRLIFLVLKMNTKYLADRLNHIEALSPQEIDLLESVFKPHSVKRNTFLVEAEMYTDYVGFVNDGIFRTFFYNRNGQEITKYFSARGEFVCDFASFENVTKTSDYIQAETDCELIITDRKGIDILSKGLKKWDYYLFKIYQDKHQKRLTEREQQIGLSQSEIYLQFLGQNPFIVKNVPVGHIASYLGIPPQSLSRIRKSSLARIN